MEMNRLGMLIDLAHVPVEVMHQVLDMSKAPVIFSHSSAYDICKHKRNVPNEVIKKVVSACGFKFERFPSRRTRSRTVMREEPEVFTSIRACLLWLGGTAVFAFQL